MDRRGIKPVLSAGSFAIGTRSLDEDSNKPDTVLPCSQYPHYFSTNCMPTWWLPLPVAALAVKNTAVQKQLTFVHDRFLERGQEVSHDLFLMSRRNFSLKLGGHR